MQDTVQQRGTGFSVQTVVWALAGIGIAVGVWLRLAPIFADFPFGDGGLFWVMAGDLRANGFVPPDTTSFNAAGIPWMYPPVGLYILALTGGGIDWLRYLPALFAILTLPAMWLLARALISERGAIVAVAAYGLSTTAYLGLIAGGGVTRGPGMLFAILTLWAVARGHVARAGLLGGLVILTHPISAFYAGLAAAALWATRGAERRMLLAPLISLAMGAAWFVPMILLHGLESLTTGAGSRQLDLPNNALVFLAQALNPPNLAFTIGAVGLMLAARRRRWDLLAWVGVTFLGSAVVDRWLVLPFAVLAGLAVDAALEHLPDLRSAALLGVAAVVTVASVVAVEAPEPLAPEERAVMTWAGESTETDATFAVIGYRFDAGMIDWFPAVAGRRNLTTWQGTEWVAGGYTRAAAEEAGNCRSVDCLPEADYYVLRPGCCAELESALAPVRDRVFRNAAP